MKLRSWMNLGLVFLFIFMIFIIGCGNEKNSLTSDESNSEKSSESPMTEVSVLGVQGSGAFASQCPHGFFSDPKPIPLEFITEKNPKLSQIELNEHLPAFTFQIDCIKMTLDVRKEGITPELTTWEVMPDGNFYLTIPAGTAKLKKDFKQDANCNTPLKADMWGKIDCTDLDHPIIKIETVWWTGQNPSESSHPQPSPSPSSRPSSGPGPLPQPSQSPTEPHLPQPTPSPEPSPSFGPWPSPGGTTPPMPPHEPIPPAPLPTFSPTPGPSLPPWPSRPSPLRARSTESLALIRRGSMKQPSIREGFHELMSSVSTRLEAPQCQIPTGSYFHNITVIQQCR